MVVCVTHDTDDDLAGSDMYQSVSPFVRKRSLSNIYHVHLHVNFRSEESKKD